MTSQDLGKKNAGETAVRDLVKPGMKLGLGTGSTALWAVRETGRLYQAGLLPGLMVVTTSLQTLWECEALGLPLFTLNSPQMALGLDLYIDGADEIDPDLNCIKGGGAAHLQEKITCAASREFVIIADETKLVPHLGTGFPVPLEIHEMARNTLIRTLEQWGVQAKLRFGQGKQGPVVTDNGHVILDLTFPEPIDPQVMAPRLKLLTGVFEVGLFPGMAQKAYIGLKDGSLRIIEKKSP